jgi:hypothetical protein
MTPPLLLNENVPLPSANRLRGAGWDVLAIAESHVSIDDTGVMRLARDTSRWLITEFLRQFIDPNHLRHRRVSACRPDPRRMSNQ